MGKNVVEAASKTLALTLRKIAPEVLTWPQATRLCVEEVKRKLLLLRGKGAAAGGPGGAPQMSFGESKVSHFLIHAGGWRFACWVIFGVLV